MKSIHSIALTSVLAAVAFASPVLAGDSMKHHTSATESLQGLSGAEFDQRFLSKMRDHHEHGAELAALAKQRAQKDEVKEFANHISSSQQREIGQIERLIADVSRNPGSGQYSSVTEDTSRETRTATSGTADRDAPAIASPGIAGTTPGAGTTSGMSSTAGAADTAGTAAKQDLSDEQAEKKEKMMQKLESASGAEFDRQFVDIMTKHHQAGLAMAQLARTRASSDEVKEFAENTAKDQQKELEKLQDLQSS